MGHIGIKGLRSAVDGLPLDDLTHFSCKVCARANIRRSPFPQKASHHSTRLLERIHCDICGPLPPCYRNFSYYILFIDYYSRFITLFLMKSRNKALSLFTQFKSAAKNFCNQKISILQVDNAPELVHGQMQQFCTTSGISYEKTIPNSPSQNSIAERTNLTICSMACAMLIDTNLRDYFWPFAVLTTAHIKQRVPHSSIPPNITPFQLWFNHKPDLSHLRPFGSKCTARIISNHNTKFEPHGESGCFLGYAKDAKGYLIWVTNTDNNGGTLKVRRDVVFHDLTPHLPSPNVPLNYRPLWEDIPFQNRLHTSENESPIPIPNNPIPGYSPENIIKSVPLYMHVCG